MSKVNLSGAFGGLEPTIIAQVMLVVLACISFLMMSPIMLITYMGLATIVRSPQNWVPKLTIAMISVNFLVHLGYLLSGGLLEIVPLWMGLAVIALIWLNTSYYRDDLPRTVIFELNNLSMESNQNSEQIKVENDEVFSLVHAYHGMPVGYVLKATDVSVNALMLNLVLGDNTSGSAIQFVREFKEGEKNMSLGETCIIYNTLNPAYPRYRLTLQKISSNENRNNKQKKYA